jgi:5'-nucleotidase (lipoprotein e(P4) family)
MKFTRLSRLFLFSLALVGCATSEQESIRHLYAGTDWVANSPEWAIQAERVYAEATAYIENEISERSEASWAVIMDVDETVLNNVTYQIRLERNGETYTPETWFLWTQEEAATLVPGAAAFIESVNSLGGYVALVTNRSDKEQLATENNLAKLGIDRGDDFRVLITRSMPNGESDKQARFELARQTLIVQGYPDVEIVAYVGDNIGDKPDAAGNWRFFCINQGGMYGDPCAQSLQQH